MLNDHYYQYYHYFHYSKRAINRKKCHYQTGDFTLKRIFTTLNPHKWQFYPKKNSVTLKPSQNSLEIESFFTG